MKVFIAPWGAPKEWKEIIYRYDGITSSKRSKSGLPFVKERENPDKIFIIVSDTLIDLDSIFNSISKDFSYSDLKQKVKDYITNDFCKEKLGVLPDDVIVSYGFGEFKNVKFSGNAMDFYYKVLKELSIIFSQLLKGVGSEEKIEIIFDATHGINYTTLLSYRALKDILEILAYGFEVRMKVLNADPYVSGLEEKGIFNINVIEDTKILPRILVYNDSKRPIEPFRGILDRSSKQTSEKETKNYFEELGQEIDKHLNFIFSNGYAESRKKVMVFLGSLLFALPVFLIRYMQSSNELSDKIGRISQKFEEKISVSTNGKLEIRRVVQFSESFANFVKAFLVSSILEKLGFERQEEVPLKVIEELKKKIFDRKFQVESNRIDVEIRDIKSLRDSLGKLYRSYCSIIEEKKCKKHKKDIDDEQRYPSKRNFFAHAGFEQNIILLCEKDGNIYISIGNEEESENLIIDDIPKI
jgi:CRISPR-associated protein Csx1